MKFQISKMAETEKLILLKLYSEKSLQNNPFSFLYWLIILCLAIFLITHSERIPQTRIKGLWWQALSLILAYSLECQSLGMQSPLCQREPRTNRVPKCVKGVVGIQTVQEPACCLNPLTLYAGPCYTSKCVKSFSILTEPKIFAQTFASSRLYLLLME